MTPRLLRFGLQMVYVRTYVRMPYTTIVSECAIWEHCCCYCCSEFHLIPSNARATIMEKSNDDDDDVQDIKLQVTTCKCIISIGTVQPDSILYTQSYLRRVNQLLMCSWFSCHCFFFFFFVLPSSFSACLLLWSLCAYGVLYSYVRTYATKCTRTHQKRSPILPNLEIKISGSMINEPKLSQG